MYDLFFCHVHEAFHYCSAECTTQKGSSVICKITQQTKNMNTVSQISNATKQRSTFRQEKKRHQNNIKSTLIQLSKNTSVEETFLRFVEDLFLAYCEKVAENRQRNDEGICRSVSMESVFLAALMQCIVQRTRFVDSDKKEYIMMFPEFEKTCNIQDIFSLSVEKCKSAAGVRTKAMYMISMVIKERNLLNRLYNKTVEEQ